MNVTLVAFTGGTAVGALVMSFFGVQAGPPALTARAAAPPPDAIVSEQPDVIAWEQVASVEYRAATSRTRPLDQPARTLSSAPVQAPAPMIVTSIPTGARVTIDGIGWGETPVTIRYLPPGQKVVRLTKEGYVTQERIVSVGDDRPSAAVRVTLPALN